MRLPPLVFLFLATAAAAEAPVRCTPFHEGAVACLDGKLCECRHDPGGSLTGRRAGVRWSCSPLRPACGATPPASVEAGGQSGQPLPYPPFAAPQAGWR